MGRPRVGFVFGTTRLRANAIGRDLSLLQCSKLIERVACRFFLPRVIVRNAVLTAERLLPDTKAHGVTVPAVSAYSLLHACRSARIFHVGFDELLKAFSEAGHEINARQLLRVGSESSLPLPAVKPEALAQGAVARLRSDIAIQSRIKGANLDEAEYFVSLVEVARAMATDASTMGGFSPRTVAAASVYLASRRLGPKVIRQKEAAESLGIAEYTVREFCRKFVRSREAR
jgi:transcription initiation factor TFIIIB Brf1 subunit/transcription initiation factor TFIIB